MMTKAWLSRRDVPFEARDIEANPEALAEMIALGSRSVPTVVADGQVLSGWNPTKLAAIVGVSFQERTGSPTQLLSSIRTILDAAGRAILQIPDDRLTVITPDQRRPLRRLLHHLLRTVEQGVDADILETTVTAPHAVPPTASAAHLARYSEAVRAKLNAWYTDALVADEARFERAIAGSESVGTRSLAQVLERTRLHAGQHLLQIYATMRANGIEAEHPLSKDDLVALGMEALPDSAF